MTRATSLLILVSLLLAACEGPPSGHAASPAGPGGSVPGLTGELAPIPAAHTRVDDDVAAALGALVAPAPTGETAEVPPADRAALAKVHTHAGDVPQLAVKHEGEALPLPLRHTRAEIEVSGFVGRATVTQTCQNPFTYPIEAVYTFPLPANSAVDDMRMVIGDRVIESEVQRRAQARATYEAAREQGQTAALLEQERPNIFTQSVAHIAPGEDIEVVVSYVQDLTCDAGEYEVVFPMVVGPRFMPDGAPQLAPPILGRGERSGRDIAVALTLDAGHEVVDYAAPTHEVDVVEADGRLSVSLAAGDRVPNRDFVFRWRVATEAPQATLMAHRRARGGGFFALMLQPPDLDVDELVGQRELIFVVDVSGSMSGVPLAMCKEAMQEALGRLRPVDTFDIVTFAGRTARAFGTPRIANHAHVREGLAFIHRAIAGGGTFMADAVGAALAPPVAEDRHRYVFFLTDGYVGNEAEIFRGAESLVRALEARGQRGRVFAMGTGGSVNRHLLDGLSAAGQGTSLYVGNREEPTRAVDRFFGLIDHPVLTDVSVDWGGLAVSDVLPGAVPDLFASRPVIVHGRYAEPGEGLVTVRGTAAGRKIELPTVVQPVVAPEDVDPVRAGGRFASRGHARASVATKSWLHAIGSSGEGGFGPNGRGLSGIGSGGGGLGAGTASKRLDDAFAELEKEATVPSGRVMTPGGGETLVSGSLDKAVFEKVIARRRGRSTCWPARGQDVGAASASSPRSGPRGPSPLCSPQ